MSCELNRLVILGSTGSIGTQALQIVDQHPDKFQVVALAALDEVDLLVQQVNKYHPTAVCLGDPNKYNLLQQQIGNKVKIFTGIEGMCELAGLPGADTVLVAVSGAVGISPTLEAIKSSKRIALANKETLVAAGEIVMQQAQDSKSQIIPVDSEHSAIFQCLQGEQRFLKNLWLTASGGPFRDFDYLQLEKVTPEMALKHPNWKMGPKVTIDSATLMNKGLEVIEAHHLFNVRYDHIKVVIHQESIIHSMIELVDGSFIGHLGAADMRIPIQYAFSFPDRYDSPAQHLDFTQLGAIHFQAPDLKKFPALALAYAAGQRGGTLPAVMNAANEIAVNSFLHRKISFLHISNIVEKVMNKHKVIDTPSLDDILAADLWAREICLELINKEVIK